MTSTPIALRSMKDGDGRTAAAILGMAARARRAPLSRAQLAEIENAPRSWHEVGGECWVIVAIREVVGFAAVRPVQRRQWAFGPFCVAPTWRGLGLARRLVETAQRHVRDRGGHGLVVGGAEGAPDRGFLRAVGFVEDAATGNFVHDPSSSTRVLRR